jgi:hypothetical protein
MSTVILIANQPSPMGLMYSLEALVELAREHPEKYYVEGDKLLLKETRPTTGAVDSAFCTCPMFFDDGRSDPAVCEFCGKPQSH